MQKSDFRTSATIDLGRHSVSNTHYRFKGALGAVAFIHQELEIAKVSNQSGQNIYKTRWSWEWNVQVDC